MKEMRINSHGQFGTLLYNAQLFLFYYDYSNYGSCLLGLFAGDMKDRGGKMIYFSSAVSQTEGCWLHMS